MNAGSNLQANSLRGAPRWAWLPIPLLLAALAGLSIADPRSAFSSPTLLLVLNLFFATFTSASVAYLAARGFLVRGSPALLLLGCGVIFWGLAGAASAAAGRGNINASLTIHNLTCWCSAACHLGGVFLASHSQRLARGAAWWLLSAYLATLVMVALIVAAAVEEVTPVFFIQDEGGTLVRYLVLGSAAAMFAISASVLDATNRTSPSAFRHCYGMGLLLVATSLAALMFQSVHDSAFVWVARSAQWLGGLYMVVAAVAAARESGAGALSLIVTPSDGRVRYALALGLVVGGFLFRLLAMEALGSHITYVTFYPAVMLASLYGGRGPGLLAAGLSALTINLFWFGSFGVPDRAGPDDWANLAVFLAGSTAVALLTGAMQNAQKRALCAENKVLMAAERERAAEALRESAQEARAAQQRAEAASRAKDDFLAALSHELRTPLTPVLMTAAALREDERLPEDVRGQLAMIQRNVALEARIIDDLLDLTRITRGKLTVRAQLCDTHSLLGLAAEIVRNEAREKDITIHLDLTASQCHLNGDPTRLQQVFWNLIRNAVKYTPRGGHIYLRSENPLAEGAPGDPLARIGIEVRDNGIGLDGAALERIFEPFEQALPHQSHRFGGLGLGLAIARAIVDLHGGRLWAESAGPGQGSSFRVELPVLVGVSAPVVGAPFGTNGSAPHALAGDPPMRLLVVEDHLPTLQVLLRLLTRVGHRPVGAGSIAEALALANAQTFDAVVSDLGLPDGTALELMAELRAKYGLRGIVVSGYGMEEDLARSREAGVLAHLIKPIDLDELRGALRQLAASNAMAG